MQADVPTLKKCCLVALIRCRRYLGDVGYLDVESVREVLYHCSVEELRCIEDMTMEGSNRDLSWYTWHYWLEHYRKKFGIPRANFQAPPLPAQAPEDYTPPMEAEAAADWRRAYFDRKEADAALVNRLGQQVKAMYQQAEADRASKQAQVCNRIQSDKVRRRSAPVALGAKRPAPAATPADKQKCKVLKSIGLSAPSMSSRGPPQAARKVTITRTVVPQPPRPSPPHAASPPAARLNPMAAARLSSHAKTSTSALLPPSSKPAPRPNPYSMSPSKPQLAAPSPPPSSHPSSRPAPSLHPHPAKASKPAPFLGSGRPPPTSSSSPGAPGHKQQAAGRLPQSSPGGARGPAAKPAKPELSRLSDAQLEAELARRRRLGGAPGLRIMDDDDY